MKKDSLETIYGGDAATLSAQTRRYAQVRQQFLEHFGATPAYLRTPGRINLIGEHTDYNGGFVLPVALDRDVLFGVRPRSDAIVRVRNVEAGFPPFSFELADEIPAAPQGDWSNYFRGAGQEICRRFGRHARLRGMDVLVSAAAPYGVPRGAGLSSSTALTVNAALALVTLNEIDISRPDLAHLCSEAEWYVGTRGGMMDQFSALLCRRDHALFLDCRPSPGGVYAFDHIPIPDSIQIVLLDSGVHHQNVRGEFNQRVAECKIGVRLLQQRYPAIARLRDVTPGTLGVDEADFWPMIEDALPVSATSADLVHRGVDGEWFQNLIADHRLSSDAVFAVLPRCRHVLTENARVQAGIAALREGQVETCGRLMDAAHSSMSGDYGASCTQVDTLVEVVGEQPGVLGARITGAGWGGGVVALVERGCAEAWTEDARTAYRNAVGLDCEIFICRPGDGAGEVLWPDASLRLA